MRFFITGATGFLGGEIIRQLVNAGPEVRAIVRDAQNAKSMDELEIKLFRGDVTDEESLRHEMKLLGMSLQLTTINNAIIEL